MNQTEELLTVIQKISKRLHELKENKLKNLDLNDFSFSYFRYINAIDKLGNPTFVELTKNMKLSKPTVTIMVNKLIEKGYVIKTKSAEDGRVYNLSLTPKSKEIIISYDSVYEKFSEEASKHFSTEELNTLISLLKRI